MQTRSSTAALIALSLTGAIKIRLGQTGDNNPTIQLRVTSGSESFAWAQPLRGSAPLADVVEELSDCAIAALAAADGSWQSGTTGGDVTTAQLG